MITIRLVPALVLAVLTAACSGAEPDIGSAGERAQASPGYGYEFVAERVSTAGTPAPSIPAQVEGRLAPEVIRDVVRGGSGALASCAPAGAGEVVARFDIHADGSITGAHVEGATGATAACVVAALRGLRFPSSSAGTASVVYPLQF